jgi:hypothetical protein
VTVFEMDLFFEKARIRIVDSGFFIEEALFSNSPVFAGYKVLGPAKSLATSLDRVMAQVVDNIEGCLLRDETLLCGLKDGFKAAEVCWDLAQQVGA